MSYRLGLVQEFSVGRGSQTWLCFEIMSRDVLENTGIFCLPAGVWVYDVAWNSGDSNVRAKFKSTALFVYSSHKLFW